MEEFEVRDAAHRRRKGNAVIDEKCKIVAHDDMGAGYMRILFDAPGVASAAEPGQFVHVRVPGLEESALRRPFSIFDAGDGKLEVLYKKVGRGTEALSAAKPGETVRVMGPLGHGFPLKASGRALLVGGGFGVAPLYFLARKMKEKGLSPKLFVGGRTAADLLALDRFAAIGVEVAAATNDGSFGVKGLVTYPLDDELIAVNADGGTFSLFACGPDPMLKAVAMRATGTKSEGWISMDRHMACGVGACYACIQKTVRGNSRCCVEGPVFAAADLVW